MDEGGMELLATAVIRFSKSETSCESLAIALT